MDPIRLCQQGALASGTAGWRSSDLYRPDLALILYAQRRAIRQVSSAIATRTAHGCHPSRLSLSFAIRKEYAGFRGVALNERVTGTMDISRTMHFSGRAESVLGHLNKLCGLPPEEGMTIGWIHSRQGPVLIELQTNYNWWIPKEKFDDAIGIINLEKSSASPVTPSRSGISKMMSISKSRTNISFRVSHSFPTKMRRNF